MKNSFRLLIRRFVIATSFPPLINLYRYFYELVIRFTVNIFRRYPKVKAVYLRRGSAKGEIIPLISDIDFAVITNGIDEEDKKELLHKYEALVKSTTLLDKTLEIYDEETFHNRYESNNYFQYRFMEGKKTWKLLYGKDYINNLPELPAENMYGGFFTEIKVWWTIFEWRFFQNRKYSKEQVTRNNTCYKTVSEILKMNLALNKNILEFSRQNALHISKDSFKGDDLKFLEKLENISGNNFRSNEPEILDETKDFILKYLNNFYKDFKNHSYSQPLKKISQKVLFSGDESLLTVDIKEHAANLNNFIKDKWQNSYKGSYLVPSSYFNVDEFLFMVQVDPAQIPSVYEITELNNYNLKSECKIRDRIKLFLLHPNAAFQLDTDDFNKSWQSILFPPSNPEIFELLGRPEFKLDGESYQPGNFPVWTNPVEHFFNEEKKLFYELLENPSVYKLNNLDFLRIFWKTAQLVIMNRSAHNNEIIYPLSLNSIEENLASEHSPLPDNLKTLADAYRNELNGILNDISFLIPSAIDYLKSINNPINNLEWTSERTPSQNG